MVYAEQTGIKDAWPQKLHYTYDKSTFVSFA